MWQPQHDLWLICLVSGFAWLAAGKRATNKMPSFSPPYAPVRSFCPPSFSCNLPCMYLCMASPHTHSKVCIRRSSLCLCYKWQLVGNNSFIVPTNFGRTLQLSGCKSATGAAECLCVRARPIRLRRCGGSVGCAECVRACLLVFEPE